MREVKEKVRIAKIGVALVLPMLIFALLSVSFVQATTVNPSTTSITSSAQITATVSLNPGARVTCAPTVLVVGSSVQWIVCSIELDGANVNTINVNTVTLGTATSACSIPADTNFFAIGDANNNGIKDASVRFSRSAADANCFGTITSPKTFQLVIAGKTSSNFPFKGASPLLYFTSCEGFHVDVTQTNSSSLLGRINLIKPTDPSFFDQSKFTPTKFSINGFFDCRNQRLLGNMNFDTKGYLSEPYTIKFLGIPITLQKRRSVTISVVFTTLDNCFSNSTPYIECTGKGVMIIDKQEPFERERINLDTVRVEINKGLGKIQGGKFFNDIIDIDKMFGSRIRIKPSIPKI
jgi:hypothetical protein